MKRLVKYFMSAAVIAATSLPVFSQAKGGPEVFTTPLPINGEAIMYLVGLVVFILLILVFVLWRISAHLKSFYKGEFDKEEEEYKYPWERLFQFKPVSSDKDAMMHHEYDGIRELDNPPPPWFMFLFYGTIVFAVVYFVRYSITKNGPSQEQEYLTELADAEVMHKTYLAKAANLIDENSVVVLAEKSDIGAGAAVFKEKCAVCHLDKGQGSVGPNLTDQYWIHGGGIKDIFKTIKYGVVEKGMQSWQKDLDPKKMQQVASFILTLQGTNPPGGKAPQGDKYIPEGAPEESATAFTDSSKTAQTPKETK
jgi:cytochrome c oxidase cbb3-type subunit 3